MLLDWPLRDLLLAYVAHLKQQAHARYRDEVLVWAMLAPHQKNRTKPPELPPILKRITT